MKQNEITPPPRVQVTSEVKWADLLLKKRLQKFLEELKDLFGEQVSLHVFFENLAWVQAQRREINALVDRYFESANLSLKEPIQCQGGCSNCCHHFPSTIEPFELLCFYGELRSREEFAEWIHGSFFRVQEMDLLLQKTEDPEEDDEALGEYFAKSLPCVFLQENRCSVYSARPITCRMYFSLSSGEFCVPEWINTDKNRNFIHYFSDEVEILIDRIGHLFNDLDLSQDLFRGILQLNQFEPELPKVNP